MTIIKGRMYPQCNNNMITKILLKKKKMKEGKYNGRTVYSCMKKEQ
jgi:hypothetical protein